MATVEYDYTARRVCNRRTAPQGIRAMELERRFAAGAVACPVEGETCSSVVAADLMAPYDEVHRIALREALALADAWVPDPCKLCGVSAEDSVGSGVEVYVSEKE